MKTSELIEVLTDGLANVGDLDVVCRDKAGKLGDVQAVLFNSYFVTGMQNHDEFVISTDQELTPAIVQRPLL